MTPVSFDGAVYVTICALVLMAFTYRKRIPAIRPAFSSRPMGPCMDAAPPTFYSTGSHGAGRGTPSDLSNSNADPRGKTGSTGSLSGLPPSGAPAVSSLRSETAVLYWWRTPGEGKKMLERGWELEHVDPRYLMWLMRKEERGW